MGVTDRRGRRRNDADAGASTSVRENTASQERGTAEVIGAGSNLAANRSATALAPSSGVTGKR